MPIMLGDHSYVHDGDIVNTFDAEVIVGKFTSIAKGLTVLGGRAEHASILPEGKGRLVSNYPFQEFWNSDWPCCGNRGPIVVGNDVWIGTNVLLLDGVTIGDGAIVGAGAVVTHDVEPYAIVAGNPARQVKLRFPYELIQQLRAIAWWNWPIEMIRANLHVMRDVEMFVAHFGIPSHENHPVQ